MKASNPVNLQEEGVTHPRGKDQPLEWERMTLAREGTTQRLRERKAQFTGNGKNVACTWESAIHLACKGSCNLFGVLKMETASSQVIRKEGLTRKTNIVFTTK